MQGFNVTAYYVTPDGVVIGQMEDPEGRLFNFTANPVANKTLKLSARAQLYDRDGREIFGQELPEGGEEFKLEDETYFLGDHEAAIKIQAVDVDSLGGIKRRRITEQDKISQSLMHKLSTFSSS